MRAWLGRLIGGSSAAVLWPCLLVAQTAPPQVPVEAQPDKDIVVTAPEPPSVNDVQKQARSITGTKDIFTEPMARFQAPVCPGIIGMPRDYATWMVDRIRADADRANMLIGEDGCHANLIVAFVIDGHAEVNKLIRTHGYMFAGLDTAETKELQAETGPVHAWTYTQMRTRDGMGSSGNLGGGAGPDVPIYRNQNGDSRITLATRLDIGASVVVIDIAAIDGLTLDQIADYAAMRGLVKTKPPRDTPATGTILTLFSPDGPRQDGLTSFDIAYIESAYNSLSNLPAYNKVAKAARETVRMQAEAKR